LWEGTDFNSDYNNTWDLPSLELSQHNLFGSNNYLDASILGSCTAACTFEVSFNYTVARAPISRDCVIIITTNIAEAFTISTDFDTAL
jgi:hypothetical protein